MWPLQYFESETPSFPEIDNAPAWEGRSSLILAILLFLALRFWVRTKWGKCGLRIPFIWIMAVVILVVLRVAAKTWGAELLNVAAPFVTIIAFTQSILLFPFIARSTASLREKISLAALTTLTASLLLLSYVIYFISYVFYLPASYAPEARHQLCMMRRIVEVEISSETYLSTVKLVPISSAHLLKDGTDLIPDSLRQNGEYQGYYYELKFDSPKPGQFTIDATPLNYRPGMPSFHEFDSTNGDKYPVYCATMADRRGNPANEHDPHFHARTLLPWLRKSAVSIFFRGPPPADSKTGT